MRRLAFPVAGLCGLALAVVPALASHQSVTTSGNTFTPNLVNVEQGGGHDVTIRNGGMGNHNLLWADGAPGESGATQSDPSFLNWSVTRKFDSEPAGDYVFYCSVHGTANSGMRGTVRVGGGGGGTTTGGTTTTSTTPPPTETTPPPTGTTTQTTPPPADTTPPRITRARTRATRRGVTMRLTLSEPAAIRARLFRGFRRLLRRTFDVERSGTVTLRLRRALRRGRYRIVLTLADDAGNLARRTLRVRVR